MNTPTKEIIENLYPMNACLLGEGYDNRLEYLKHLLDLEVIEVPSGTKFGTWTVPDEWMVRDAWVKFNGKKIVDYSKEPLSLLVYSKAFKGVLSKEEFVNNIYYANDFADNGLDMIPYKTSFYEKKWGICMSKKQFDTLEEGEYEVYIDTEFKPGIMKLGIHTIPGKSEREILLFSHLDHPFQANDNLSAVACLADLATKIKCEHTVKVVFCPETIGSIAYAHTQDLSKVDFVIAVDICGNENSILLQKSFNQEDRVNRVAHLALHSLLQDNRKGLFRSTIGSDETVFNDPLINIPGIMLSTWPYPEYHTSKDTPEIINYEAIKKMQALIKKIIEIWESDFIPVKEFKGPLMRSKYGVQSSSKKTNLQWDYFIYSMDGKKTLAELCCEHGLVFELTLPVMLAMEKDGVITKMICQQESTKEQKNIVRRPVKILKSSGKVEREKVVGNIRKNRKK